MLYEKSPLPQQQDNDSNHLHQKESNFTMEQRKMRIKAVRAATKSFMHKLAYCQRTMAPFLHLLEQSRREMVGGVAHDPTIDQLRPLASPGPSMSQSYCFLPTLATWIMAVYRSRYNVVTEDVEK